MPEVLTFNGQLVGARPTSGGYTPDLAISDFGKAQCGAMHSVTSERRGKGGPVVGCGHVHFIVLRLASVVGQRLLRPYAFTRVAWGCAAQPCR